jgi:RNA polymerase sigma-54 factor
LKKQLCFFNAETGTLVPLSMKEAAEELALHESTIARAVANKYLACPQGTFTLRSFFTQGMQKKNGDKISNQSIREMLFNIIDKEDQENPLSDEDLAQHLSKIGIPCARRTVAKYRSIMRIPPACKRKRFG